MVVIAIISICGTIIATGIALACILVPSLRSVHIKIDELGKRLGDLAQRVARIEGILQTHGLNGALRLYATDEMPKEPKDDESER